MRIRALRRHAAACLLAPLAALGISSEACAGPGRDRTIDPWAVPARAVTVGYPLAVRPIAGLPPCRLGSARWYGPYGYICYRPQPGLSGLPGPYLVR
ncbi:hypothetical protein Q8W71_07255 [Methylobacterium sp. NEAU 140]|nr:hypothetical protein [Methylobacterium sp. NEAU 140]